MFSQILLRHDSFSVFFLLFSLGEKDPHPKNSLMNILICKEKCNMKKN